MCNRCIMRAMIEQPTNKTAGRDVGDVIVMVNGEDDGSKNTMTIVMSCCSCGTYFISPPSLSFMPCRTACIA